MGSRGLVAVVVAAVVVVGVFFTGNLRTCYSHGFEGPEWVAQQHGNEGNYCTAPWWEYLYPWHWGAEEVCIGCLLLDDG
jgi:hypothetical protein